VQVDDVVPGRSGPFATTEAHDADAVVTSYNPDTDGDPDPGEIVWSKSPPPSRSRIAIIQLHEVLEDDRFLVVLRGTTNVVCFWATNRDRSLLEASQGP
jgi:hypothetical protein